MLSGIFENCYGIKEFDMGNGINFSQSNKAIIYAPNGVMKSSFSKVFEDLSKGEPSRDRIFTEETTTYSIHYHDNDYAYSSANSRSIPKCDNVYVVNSFLDNFEFTKETVSTLLADESTRNEYNSLVAQFSSQIKNLVAILADKSGMTKPRVKDSLAFDFGLSASSDWPDIISSLHSFIKEKGPFDAYLGEIKLAELFNEKTMKEFVKPEFKQYIKQYIDRLEELLQSSELLNDSFTDRSAETLTKTFSTNNLFSAQHKIVLRDGTEIHTIDEWRVAVESQLKRLFEDETLQTAFDRLKKNLTANNDVDTARNIIIKYKQIIPLLFDIIGTRCLMWATYCSQLERPFEDYYKEISRFTEQVRILYEKAAVHSEQWRKVVDEFNRRFRVPFSVQINNKSSFILKDEAPNISFVYKRGEGITEESVDLTKDELFPSLSLGEKRAMYLLYVLFNLESIKNQADSGHRFLIIADDIADSFDYKNKYAIIEYLADLSQNPGIDLLILTHNFDFFRTVLSRLGLMRNHCYIAQKHNAGIITMKEFRYQKDFFQKVIIAGIKGTDIFKQKKMLVASIPFYRNLSEYCGDDADYLKLTCFLHYKSAPIDIERATLSDLWSVIGKYVKSTTSSFGGEPYLEAVQSLADDISHDDDEISLENKLIISIASRIRAEKYLKQIIVANEGSCPDSESNQMRVWSDKAKPYLSDDEKRLIDDINLITPESIHLNSFMYEPIIDISIWTLQDLFSRTMKLHLT